MKNKKVGIVGIILAVLGIGFLLAHIFVPIRCNCFLPLSFVLIAFGALFLTFAIKG